MINPTGKKLEKILFDMFDDDTQGVDVYNHNGSMWIIFTDEMRWVLEFTKDRTLYYNYTFFRNEMEMLSLDCVENKYLIQKWFESRFLNINTVEYTIQNGVKYTEENCFLHLKPVKDAIQNGVKDTFAGRVEQYVIIKDTIQNGVKKIYWVDYSNRRSIVNAIRDGIKEN